MSGRDVLPFAVFAAFMTLFWVRARREGLSTREWLRRRNRETFTTPGWWKPMAVAIGLIAVLLIVAGALAGEIAAALLSAAAIVAFSAAAMFVVGWWGRRL